MTKKRPLFIAGNWKMNNNQTDTRSLLEQLVPVVDAAACQVAACVPFVNLQIAKAISANSTLLIGAQNCHWAESGAFTGEISPAMLTDMGITHVILGHSERRQYFAETDETVNMRIRAALQAGLHVIFCVGERLEEREADITDEVIQIQLKKGLQAVSAEQCAHITIAYEPVWAIGTGKTATVAQAVEVIANIRKNIGLLYGQGVAEQACIQYGGSMNAANALELLSEPEIDGGLIGGASLKAEDFAKIIEAANSLCKK